MEKLINQLIDDQYLKTPQVIEAFRKIHRSDFLPEEMADQAGMNIPLPIRFGQTITQPLTVALMLELLQAKRGDIVLDIGTGSGWQAALIAHIVGPQGKVISIERIPQLVQFAKRNVAKYNLKNLVIVHGDGSAGLEKHGPYDRIIAAAAAPEEVPQELIAQLKSPGRLVMPIGEWEQDMVLVAKDERGKIDRKKYPGFQFVPLIAGGLPPPVLE